MRAHFPALARTSELVAPVAVEQAEQFAFAARTFEAISRVPEAYAEVIGDLPERVPVFAVCGRECAVAVLGTLRHVPSLRRMRWRVVIVGQALVAHGREPLTTSGPSPRNTTAVSTASPPSSSTISTPMNRNRKNATFNAKITIDRSTIGNEIAETAPWTAVVPMRKTDEQIYEYACHEGNYGLPNILRAQRVAEGAPVK